MLEYSLSVDGLNLLHSYLTTVSGILLIETPLSLFMFYVLFESVLFVIIIRYS